MKNIQFRAWDKNDKKMIEVQCGWRICSVCGLHIGLAEKDYILQQSTGLKDKNGTMIFEGDRVTCQFYDDPEIRESIITWDKKMAGFTIDGYPMNVHGIHDIEIIGHVNET